MQQTKQEDSMSRPTRIHETATVLSFQPISGICASYVGRRHGSPITLKRADNHLAGSFLLIPDRTTVSSRSLPSLSPSVTSQKRKGDGHCLTGNMAWM
jgi:hypothetical protein